MGSKGVMACSVEVVGGRLQGCHKPLQRTPVVSRVRSFTPPGVQPPPPGKKKRRNSNNEMKVTERNIRGTFTAFPFHYLL